MTRIGKLIAAMGAAAAGWLGGVAVGAVPATPEPNVLAVAAANNAFFGDLYGALKEGRGNLFFSPYSISAALTMTSRGMDAGHDPSTAVVVGFYEDIPRSPSAREDMLRWFRLSEVVGMKEVFSYHIGEEGFRDLIAMMRKNQKMYRERRKGKS